MEKVRDLSNNDAEECSLLAIVNKADFSLTLLFERKLKEIFYKKLSVVVESNYSRNSVSELENYLKVVQVVSKKDSKFFSLLADIPTELLMKLIGQKFGETIPLEVGNMILKFFLELLTHHTPLRLISINHGIIQILISKFFLIDKIGDLCSIILSCEILELLTEAPLIALQLSTVDSLDSLCNVLAFLLKTKTFDPQFGETVTKCIGLISKIINNGPMNNASHLRNMDSVFPDLKEALPQLSEEIQEIHRKIKEIRLNRREATQFTSVSNTKFEPATKSQPILRAPQLTISELKQSSSDIMKMSLNSRLPMESQCLPRNTFLQKMDPESNAFLLEKKISSVSMDMTAELICGMLNSNKGGSLHIGLHSSGRVEGIRISHDERDGFRSGLDDVFLQKISPILLPSLVELRFVPVSIPGEDAGSHRSLYLIRIGIPANMNTLFYLKDNNRCFLRCRKGNNQLSNLQEIRHLAVTLIEKRFSVSHVF